jgi:hypothetical protein
MGTGMSLLFWYYVVELQGRFVTLINNTAYLPLWSVDKSLSSSSPASPWHLPIVTVSVGGWSTSAGSRCWMEVDLGVTSVSTGYMVHMCPLEFDFVHSTSRPSVAIIWMPQRHAGVKCTIVGVRTRSDQRGVSHAVWLLTWWFPFQNGSYQFFSHTRIRSHKPLCRCLAKPIWNITGVATILTLQREKTFGNHNFIVHQTRRSALTFCIAWGGAMISMRCVVSAPHLSVLGQTRSEIPQLGLSGINCNDCIKWELNARFGFIPLISRI